MASRLMRRWLTGLGLAACAAGPAQAGLFDDDEARLRIENLRNDVTEQTKRLDTLTSTTTTTSRSQLELANQIEQLKGELARLRGQNEVLTYELEAAQKRQKDFYIDLDGRLRKLETTATTEAKPAGDTSAAAAPPVRDAASEMRDYEAALTFFKGARYKEALTAFEGFIRNYGESTMLPNAHYWAASANYQLRDYPKAAELFAKVQATWPDSTKAADALLGQANSYRDAGDIKGARRVLEQLVEKYPGSNAAQAARPRLQKK
jgi:tol-pal system protein YbgF